MVGGQKRKDKDLIRWQQGPPVVKRRDAQNKGDGKLKITKKGTLTPFKEGAEKKPKTAEKGA